MNEYYIMIDLFWRNSGRELFKDLFLSAVKEPKGTLRMDKVRYKLTTARNRGRGKDLLLNVLRSIKDASVIVVAVQ